MRNLQRCQRQYDNMTDEDQRYDDRVSDCCLAPLAADYDGITHYHVCAECGNPCDVQGEQDDEP